MDANSQEDGNMGMGSGTSTNRIHPSSSPSALKSASASSSTLHSTASLHSTTTSPRNINTGGAAGTAQNAAVTGAALAFSNSEKASGGKSKAVPPVPNKNRVLLNSGADGRKGGSASANSIANTYSGKDGASAAAAAARARVGGSPVGGKGVAGSGESVGGTTRSSSTVSVMDERMGYGQQIMGMGRTGESEATDEGSIDGGSEYQGGQRQLQKRIQQRPRHLQPPFSSGASTPASGSNAKNSSAAFMAANVAAKRSVVNSPNHTGQSQGMGVGIGMGGVKQASPLPSRRQSYASLDNGERRLDVSSIPPTRSLVGMWEQTERGAMKGGGSGGGGDEIVNRQESPRSRPASSHAPMSISKPAVLARPVSSYALIPEQTKPTTKPQVQPRPSSSQAPIAGQMVSISNPPVQPRPVSSYTSGSKAVGPSLKPPAQKPVAHNTRPTSPHGPLPNPSTKPSIRPLPQRVSADVPPPTKQSTKPPMKFVQPASSHAPEPTESSSNLSVQKPSIPPPQSSSTNVPAPENQFTNPPMEAPRPLSMHTSILNSTDSSLKPSTQHPRRASTIKPPPRPSRPTQTSQPPVSKSSYNDDDDNDGSSDDSFVSASSQPKPRSPSWRAKLAQQNRLQSSSISTMTVNSLADAIVAGSLASSRASSPSMSSGTLRPPPPPTRRHKNISLFQSDTSRTPTPPHIAGSGNTPGVTVLKTTMRKPKTEKELKEEAGEGQKRRGKKHLVKKHPNKHHEGDRKRWRDLITEKERKRYEAVWASNKGLFPYTANERGEVVDVEGAEGSVPGVVVRDIWDRSRLPADVLEEVWGLVERRGAGVGVGDPNENPGAGGGRLGKEEFVVGLWLIDQRLKGRKLPGRVGKSVWGSAEGIGGIKIRDLSR
ncbi:hypothetical protein DSL72_009294 [Monilinia vaccinii-corymbosi]|uniref:EH domain-containing protein n=1 Tax=Monilinia vaccinii-corymbosi TaxID=61207 RepID=A0A8A3PPZ2_9HELO|nr:hypothetical protein DSL72_009294 [Monilinia vaccinii-corymbosi]